MNYFVIGGDGLRYGPEGIATLQTWVRENRIIRTTVLIEAPTGQALRAADIPALAIFLPGPDHSEAIRQQATVCGTFQPRPHTVGEWANARPGPKNKVVAGLLGLFLGSLGIHRYYLGYAFWGTVQLLASVATCGMLSPLIAIWGAIEGICCFAGWMNDSAGRPLHD